MALRFDAGTDLLSRSTTLPSISSFTIMGWMYFSVNTGTWAGIFYFGSSSDGWYCGMASTGVILYINRTGATWSGSTLTVGAWHHVALVVSGTGAGQALCYLNGVLNITGDGSAVTPTGFMQLGADKDGDALNGRLAAVKIYDAALTVADVAREMRCYMPVRTANLNSWLPLRDVGEQVVDYSGVGGNWTLGGTLATEQGPPIPWSLRPMSHSVLAAAAAAATTAPPVFHRPLRIWRKVA